MPLQNAFASGDDESRLLLASYGSMTGFGLDQERSSSQESLLTQSQASLAPLSLSDSSLGGSDDLSPEMDTRKHLRAPGQQTSLRANDEENGPGIAKDDSGDVTTSDSFWKFVQGTYKVAISCFIWYASYMIMAVFGGTVAFMHFPRTNLPYPHALPDYGYDAIPEWCPSIPHIPHGNIQSFILLVLYVIIWGGICCRWQNDGKRILQQLLHLNSLVFLTRTTTVSLTGLPQPNPKCTSVQAFPVNYRQAWEFVIGRGFPPHACGDLIYSGHVGCTLVCMVIMHRHGFLNNRCFRVVVWSLACLGIYATLSCRSHYTVDVVLAFYFVFFLKEFYFLRSNGVVDGPLARFIRWLEATG